LRDSDHEAEIEEQLEGSRGPMRLLRVAGDHRAEPASGLSCHRGLRRFAGLRRLPGLPFRGYLLRPRTRHTPQYERQMPVDDRSPPSELEGLLS
jgi:hypothetical protein